MASFSNCRRPLAGAACGVPRSGLTGRRHRNGEVVWVRAALLADVQRGALALAATPPEVDTVADVAGWLSHVLGYGVDGRRRGVEPGHAL
jgi:hypothetical protein